MPESYYADADEETYNNLQEARTGPHTAEPLDIRRFADKEYRDTLVFISMHSWRCPGCGNKIEANVRHIVERYDE